MAPFATTTMPLLTKTVENGVTVKTFMGAYGPVTFMGATAAPAVKK